MTESIELLAQATKALRDRVERLEAVEQLVVPGVWTPTYLGLATPGTTSYTLQEGSYTRVGRMVLASGRVVWSAATGTGAAAISLPIAAVFTRTSRFAVALYPTGLTFANGGVAGIIDSGTSANAFVLNSPATNAAGTLVAVEAAGDVSFMALYDAA